jgi:hypothetical protein
MSFSSAQKFEIAFEKANIRYQKTQGLDIELKLSKGLFFTMRASVRPSSLFTKKRKYIVYVNLLRKDILPKLSEEDLIGWFGHELAHIIDYEAMSNFELLVFAFKYLFDLKFRFSVEKRINAFTYNNGFSQELFGVWKKFLSLENVNKKYKNYIIKNYLPEWEDVRESAALHNITKVDF